MITPTDLLARAEARRTETLTSLGEQQQAKLGQFFTNSAAAQFMAGLVRLPESGTVRILDPGAGSGALTAALVARVIAEAPRLAVEVTAVEVDTGVVPALQATLDDCVAAAERAGVKFAAEVIENSFIDAAFYLVEQFDVVIQNPPYAKLAADDPARRATAMLAVDPPNIYAAFVALGVTALAPGGQLVAITPRSFTNGAYFAGFRRWLLPRAMFDRIHIFAARNSVFADTGVLQENIIYSMTKTSELPDTAILSASRDHTEEATEREVHYTEILHPKDKQLYVRIPSTPEDAELVSLMASLPCTLAEVGIDVSTGRVVDFRSREQLLESPLDEHYPMVYPANISHGVLRHPKPNGKVQWFSVTAAVDRKWLVPAGTYVLVKRFSAKEERRRLVASVWTPSEHGDTPVAFDNKLNFFHIRGKTLDGPLAMGLAIWLNSTAVDAYFRTFSGHTQVNATDLRGMRYPSAEQLRALGTGHSALPGDEVIDRLVNDLIEPKAASA
ncbi:N5-glutamine S-adenosyl-L-methionine-dependent methyltransferase [Mycobacteroides abscessus subsp. abscessus]|uniref:Eco57I restriction-modification methylase domain-containing protein n=1 Tax=Mycobacteroides abscessus TaxID=36809 RepID=UPI00092B0BA5|nr:class I SAM-dependent methyltransferase [Mycobacteroides abscessus]SIE78976.1 DNA methylase [Mycobacteroides abscessus subsp. abscessus]SLF18342.1 N5-glutamine S-adenosyl-L-methionine-dependent methyltransferase [Mycobacteroides abscessus subsp. abscessus]SLF30760.1 N5-glutamine S-adenosyl-L-methionine-dependent methyltransferase [Mycobacteroides abscessus subsp. abscessus]SLF35100.1 N5-glutamine S-adenosyl-L-methionine-dependent methyltransferase [Mycobacteroides abscessus subsp. abscessus]